VGDSAEVVTLVVVGASAAVAAVFDARRDAASTMKCGSEDRYVGNNNEKAKDFRLTFLGVACVTRVCRFPSLL